MVNKSWQVVDALHNTDDVWMILFVEKQDNEELTQLPVIKQLL